MRGADPVNDEFEVGYDQRFEGGFYRVALVGRVIMLLFVIGAIAGLYGRGPYSHASVRSSDDTLAVDYEPVARWGTPTLVTLHVQNESADPQPLAVRLDNDFVQPLGLQQTIPQPDSSVITKDGMILHFMIAAHQTNSLIRMVLKPSGIGAVASDIRLSTGTQVSWSQLIVP